MCRAPLKLQLVKSVTPLEVRKRENEESSEYGVLFSDKSPEEEESQRTPDELTTEDSERVGYSQKLT